MSLPRRSALVWTGATLAVAGLAVTGFVVWELVGTNIVSRARQAEIVDQVQHDWDTTTVNGTVDGTEPASTTRSDAADALVRIPRFGDDYVVPVLEGVDDDALEAGFGHFVASATPGRVGNYALAAHRITHGEPLRQLPSLRPGDEVVVETRARVYTYTVDTDPDALEVDLGDTWVVSPRPHNPDEDGVQPSRDRRLLTLVTCAELFHTDERMVAFGHLESVRPR